MGSSAAATQLGGFFAKRKARLALLAFSIAAVVAAGLGISSAVSGWRASDDAAGVRRAYVLVRAEAAHEEAFLRSLRAHPASQSARKTFFAATQAQTALLTKVDAQAPANQRSLVRNMERQHNSALTMAARALRGGPTGHALFNRALARLESLDYGAATAQTDFGVADVRPWPSTALERLELAAIGLVLLAGFVTLGRHAFLAAGLRREVVEGDGEIERWVHAARSDSLTGLANHRAFQDDLSKVIEHRNRAGEPFSLLAFDLDGLKQVNDVKGHLAGDQFIRAVAGCIRDEIGGHGSVYRTGGDEFMAILPDCRGWHALTYAHAIQHTSHELVGNRALSIGITESTSTESRRMLLHQADLALYEAKRAKLLAVTYHEGLEPRQVDPEVSGPSEHQKALAAALAQAVDARDSGTRNHSETVAELCVAMGKRLGIGGEKLDRLRLAGLLHDVGKIGVSDAILSKPGALAPEERTEIQLHATVGHSILMSAGLKQEAVWVLHHHERFDGEGYPTRLGGNAIPLESRIIAVADSFEAMTGTRPYRSAMTPDGALAELARNSGTQFDAQCVRALNDVFGGGRLLYADAEPGDDQLAPTVAIASA